MARDGVKIELKPREHQRLKKQIKAFQDKFILTRDEALDALAFEIRDTAIRNLKNNRTPDTGILGNSITIQTPRKGVRRIGTNAGYGLYVEFGRGPGKAPPLIKIQSWVRRKLGIGDPFKQKGVAFLIARSIAARGTKAQPFLRPAYVTATKKMIRTLKKKFR